MNNISAKCGIMTFVAGIPFLAAITACGQPALPMMAPDGRPPAANKKGFASLYHKRVGGTYFVFSPAALRNSPEKSAKSARSLEPGTPVLVGAARTGGKPGQARYRVRLKDGTTGWIHEYNLADVALKMSPRDHESSDIFLLQFRPSSAASREPGSREPRNTLFARIVRRGRIMSEVKRVGFYQIRTGACGLRLPTGFSPRLRIVECRIRNLYGGREILLLSLPYLDGRLSRLLPRSKNSLEFRPLLFNLKKNDEVYHVIHYPGTPGVGKNHIVEEHADIPQGDCDMKEDGTSRPGGCDYGIRRTYYRWTGKGFTFKKRIWRRVKR